MTIKEAIQVAQEVGHLTEDAAAMIMEIGTNQIHKRTDIPRAAREDAISRFLEKAMRKWTAIKPGQNPKAYFNRMAYTALMDELRSFDRHRRKLDHYQTFEPTDEPAAPQNKYVTPLDGDNLLRSQGIHDLRTLTAAARTEIRGYALNMLQAGVSLCRIAKHLGVNKCTVHRWKQRNTPTEKDRGRPWPTSQRLAMA